MVLAHQVILSNFYPCLPASLQCPAWKLTYCIQCALHCVQHDWSRVCAVWLHQVQWVPYSRKSSSAKNFVKSDRQAVRQEFIFVKCRSSLLCSSVVWSSLFCMSFIFTFMNISDRTPRHVHVWFVKKLVSNLISSKNWFDESDEIKFLTKISCFTVLWKFFSSMEIGVYACPCEALCEVTTLLSHLKILLSSSKSCVR